MKYRHSFHAGNFADVHKHVTLLALLAALKRKDKGFLYFDAHAGRGSYDLSSGNAEAAAGIGRLLAREHHATELEDYAALIARVRAAPGATHLYPGSPLIAALELRPQDRAVLIESGRLGARSHGCTRGIRGRERRSAAARRARRRARAAACGAAAARAARAHPARPAV